jgi:hypothetical protein
LEGRDETRRDKKRREGKMTEAKGERTEGRRYCEDLPKQTIACVDMPCFLFVFLFSLLFVLF